MTKTILSLNIAVFLFIQIYSIKINLILPLQLAITFLPSFISIIKLSGHSQHLKKELVCNTSVFQFDFIQ